jgi:hypothetical protein
MFSLPIFLFSSISGSNILRYFYSEVFQNTPLTQQELDEFL